MLFFLKRSLSKRRKLNIEKHIALLSLIIAAGSFIYSAYSDQVATKSAEVTYSNQLRSELETNLIAIRNDEYKIVDDFNGTDTSRYKVYNNVTAIVYKMGLQNGMILKMSESTQSSLYKVYQRVELLNSILDNYQVDEVITNSSGLRVKNVIIPYFAGELGVYINEAKSKELSINDAHNVSRPILGASALLMLVLAVFLLIKVLISFCRLD